jgi:hypothetical protein
MNVDLKYIYDSIDVFADKDSNGIQQEQSFELPYELSAKERANIHEYVKNKQLYSRSVSVKRSSYKKIIVHCDNSLVSEQKEIDTVGIDTVGIDTVGINLFTTYSGIPFPCPNPDLVSYYVATFNGLYDSERLWKLFCEESKVMSIKKEISEAMIKISDYIKKNPEYLKLMKRNIIGAKYKMKNDVYHFNSDDKKFLSIDIRKGNYTVLKMHCPSIFTEKYGAVLSWTEFVGKFTRSKFIAQSKQFREIIFGRIGFCKRANVLQEIIMDEVHKFITSHDEINSNLILRMKRGDENVYEIKNTDLLFEQFEFLKNLLNIHIDILHLRIFTVKCIACKPYFLKTFLYNTDWYDSSGKICNDEIPLKLKIEFKKVPKKFMLQVLKWYNKSPIENNDLYFMDEGIKCMYCATIFD